MVPITLEPWSSDDFRLQGGVDREGVHVRVVGPRRAKPRPIDESKINGALKKAAAATADLPPSHNHLTAEGNPQP